MRHLATRAGACLREMLMTGAINRKIVGGRTQLSTTPVYRSHLKIGNKFRKQHSFGSSSSTNDSRACTGGYWQAFGRIGQHSSIELIISMSSRCASPELADATELENSRYCTGRIRAIGANNDGVRKRNYPPT